MTAITDYLLSLASLYFGLRLLRDCGPSPQLRLWAIGFLLGAAAALAGGSFHAFTVAGGRGHAALWNLTLVLIGATAGMLAAAALAAPPPRGTAPARWLLAGLGASLAGLVLEGSRLRLGAFDHNALFHLAQGAAFYGFYRGARKEDSLAETYIRKRARRV